jgi:uncharacterized protein YqeY
MTLKEQLRADLATALRAGDTSKRDALRTLLAAIKQTEVDERTTLDDTGVQAVLVKQTKQRRESIADYEKAGRPDLVAKEKNDLAVIESYLPQLMTREEIRRIVVGVMAEMGITDSKGMGQLMARLMPQLKGKADGRVVNEVVRELLQTK